jgi:thymidine kinase
MNWFNLANIDSIFEQAGELEILNALRKIKDMSTQTQRGARSMIIQLKNNHKEDEEMCNLLDKAIFYSPDSPKKVKVLIDNVIHHLASGIIKKNKTKEEIVKGLIK